MPRNRTVEKLMGAIKSADEAAAGEDAAVLKLTQEAHDNDDDKVDLPEPPAPSEPDAGPPPAPQTEPPSDAPTPAVSEPAAAPPAVTKPPEKQAPEDEPLARRLGAERDRLRTALANAQQRLRDAEQRNVAPAVSAAPAVVAKAPEDPEPKFTGDPKEDPLGHQEFREQHRDWEFRELRRQVTAANERATRLESLTEQQTQVQQFDAGVAAIRNEYEATNPEFSGARDFLRKANSALLRRQGVPEHEIGTRITNMEREAMIVQANHARQLVEQGILPPDTNVIHYALEYLHGMAQDYGWQAPATNGMAPATTRTPAAQAKDTAARTAAARSISTMNHAPVNVPSPEEQMTVEKFAEMTPMQRHAYKVKHPDWESALFGKEEGTFITAR